MANNSDWLGACATKGETASNTKNAANALTCFRTIVLRLSFLSALLVRKSPWGSSCFRWDAGEPESVSFTTQLHADGWGKPHPYRQANRSCDSEPCNRCKRHPLVLRALSSLGFGLLSESFSR